MLSGALSSPDLPPTATHLSSSKAFAYHSRHACFSPTPHLPLTHAMPGSHQHHTCFSALVSRSFRITGCVFDGISASDIQEMQGGILHIASRGPFFSGLITGCTFTNISILHAVYLPTVSHLETAQRHPLRGSILSFGGDGNLLGVTQILVYWCHVSHVTVSAVPPIAPSTDATWDSMYVWEGGLFHIHTVDTAMVGCTISSIAMVAGANEAGPVGLHCYGGLFWCRYSSLDIIDSTISGVTLLASCWGVVFYLHHSSHVYYALPTYRGFELKNSRVENISYTLSHRGLPNQESQGWVVEGGVMYSEDQFLFQVSLLTTYYLPLTTYDLLLITYYSLRVLLWQGDLGEIFPDSGVRLVGAAIHGVSITLDGSLGSPPRDEPFILEGGIFFLQSSTLEVIDTSVTSISLSAPGDGSICNGGVLKYKGIALTSNYQLVQRHPDVAFLRCVISDVHSSFKEIKGGVIYPSNKVGVSCPLRCPQPVPADASAPMHVNHSPFAGS